jgi:Holliday junction resolvase-like predicted endonuclease
VNDSCAGRAAAIERAANAIEAAKLRVIDRDWSSGGHHLDLVATPGEDILAAVEVRAVAHGIPGACVTAVTEDRFRQATDASRAWMREHGTRYEDLWLVIVTVDPDGCAEATVGNAAEGVA